MVNRDIPVVSHAARIQDFRDTWIQIDKHFAVHTCQDIYGTLRMAALGSC
jgi:hypothetical protein